MTSNADLLTTTWTLTLKEPLSGYLVPIEGVNDPVFCQKVVGDGVALDPVRQSLVAQPSASANRLAMASTLKE